MRASSRSTSAKKFGRDCCSKVWESVAHSGVQLQALSLLPLQSHADRPWDRAASAGVRPDAVEAAEIRMGNVNWLTVGEPYEARRDSVVHAQFNAAYSFARALTEGGRSATYQRRRSAIRRSPRSRRALGRVRSGDRGRRDRARAHEHPVEGRPLDRAARHDQGQPAGAADRSGPSRQVPRLPGIRTGRAREQTRIAWRRRWTAWRKARTPRAISSPPFLSPVPSRSFFLAYARVLDDLAPSGRFRLSWRPPAAPASCPPLRHRSGGISPSRPPCPQHLHDLLVQALHERRRRLSRGEYAVDRYRFVTGQPR